MCSDGQNGRRRGRAEWGKGVENAPILSAATTASSPPPGGPGRNGGREGGASQSPRSADLPGRPGSPPPARRRETAGGAEGSPSPAAAARRPSHRLRCGQTARAPAPPLSPRAPAEEGRRRTPRRTQTQTRPGPGPGPGRRCKGAGAADLPSSAVSILSGGAVVTQPRGSPGRGRSLRGPTGRRGGRRERSRPGQVRVLRCGRGSESQARAEGAGEADRAGRRGAGEGRGARPGRGAGRKGRAAGEASLPAAAVRAVRAVPAFRASSERCAGRPGCSARSSGILEGGSGGGEPSPGYGARPWGACGNTRPDILVLRACSESRKMQFCSAPGWF